jgi:hypothetical protein
MTRDNVLKELSAAANNGTLLTAKHDPDNLGTTYADYRSVLSFELSKGLEGFISSGQFKIVEYENSVYPTSPTYLEIEPSANSSFSVPASGVPGNSPMATKALDRIVAVSGHNQGWHVFGESSVVIQQKITAGELVNGTVLG